MAFLFPAADFTLLDDEMIRRWFWALTLLCCSGAVAAESLRSEQKSAANAACLYNSRSYSDGAFICVQKSLMLSCSSDGARATWKIVADKDLNERCVTATAPPYPPELRRHVRRPHAIYHRTRPVAEGSPKCFTFNGKQYCE